LDEVKLDGLRVFDSFGFGSTALLIFYLIYNKTFLEYEPATLIEMPEIPAYLGVPIATASIFFIHLLGRGVMKMGEIILNKWSPISIEAEIKFLLMDNPHTLKKLLDTKEKLRFTEGVFGLNLITIIFTGAFILARIKEGLSEELGAGLIAIAFLILFARLVVVSHLRINTTMSLFIHKFELARSDSPFSSNMDS
jgi:hypothetical protein